MKNFDFEELKAQILSFGRNAERLDIIIDDAGLTVKLRDYPTIRTTFTTDDVENMTGWHKIDISYLLSLMIIAYDAGKFDDARKQYYFGEDMK